MFCGFRHRKGNFALQKQPQFHKKGSFRIAKAMVIEMNKNKKYKIGKAVIGVMLSALMVISVFVMPSCTANDSFSIDIIQTGDADCILICSGGKSVLIDVGEKDDYDRIKSVMDKRKVDSIDLMILTHYDNDHVGSASSVIYDYKVSEVIGPDYIRESSSMDNLDRALRYCGMTMKKLPGGSEELKYEFGKAVLTVDVPQKKEYAGEDDYSLIVSLSYEGRNFLFMGDAMKERIGEYLPKLEGDYYMVKLPHHGEYYSTLGDLFKMTKITFAVVSVGNAERVGNKVRLTIEGTNPKGLYTYDGTVSIEFRDGEFRTYQ